MKGVYKSQLIQCGSLSMFVSTYSHHSIEKLRTEYVRMLPNINFLDIEYRRKVIADFQRLTMLCNEYELDPHEVDDNALHAKIMAYLD